MKRYRVLSAILCCLLLAGCGREENPYRVDTVVRIPVDPTEAAAETEAETEAPTEEPTEEPASEETTQPTEKASAGSGKTSSSTKKSTSTKKNTSTKKSTSTKSSSVDQSASSSNEQHTEEPETEPPTQPPTEAEETEAPTQPPFNPADYSAGSLEYAILDELNVCRMESGAGELTMSAKLCGIAALRAREVARVWSHTRPDGRNYTSAMSDYSYSFSVSAENLAHATGSGKAAAIVEKWMNADNRENILDGSFTKAGVGVYRADGVVWVVALLAG